MIVTIDAEPVEEPDHRAQGNAAGVSLRNLINGNFLWTTDVVLKMSWGHTSMRSPRLDISQPEWIAETLFIDRA